MNISKISDISSPFETSFMKDQVLYHLTNVSYGWQIFENGGEMIASITSDGTGFRALDGEGYPLTDGFAPLPKVIHQVLSNV